MPDTDDTPAELERRFFELARDALLVADDAGVIVRANRAALVLLGGNAVGTRLGAVLHADDAATLAAVLGTERLSAQVRLTSAAGIVVTCELDAVADGDAGGVFITLRDVTATGGDAGERARQVFEHSPTGMAIVSPQGRLLRVNEALCALIARSADDLLKRTIVDIAADSAAAEHWAATTFADELPASVRLEARLRRGDGGEVVTLVSATQVHGPAGDALYYVCQFEDVTARVRAQEQLEAGEAKLADAQQVARLGSWDWNLANGQISWSDELFRICGMRPEPGPRTPQDVIESVHPDDRSRARRTVERALEAGAPWHMDVRIVRRDGDVRMLHSRGEIVRDTGGQPAGMHGTCQDITESRRVEDALRATEQLFRRAFDDAPIGMALVDLDGRWLRLNRSVGQMCGYTEAQMRARTIDELGHPDDRELDQPLIRELLSGRRRSYSLEKRMIHADGRVLHVLGHVSLMHGEGEQPLYFLIQLVDLSDRRQMEAERRADQERLQEIVDNAPALIAVQDAEERLLLVNRRWEEAYGVDAQSALGRTPREIVRGALDPEVARLHGEVLRTGAALEVQTAVTDAAGHERPMLLVTFPLRDAGGKPAAVCSIGTDLTERLRSEHERAELERRLAQAERLESVGQLAGGVAHDFNNLLSVILSCVDFAEQRLAPDDPVRGDVIEIQHAAERAAALTRQLLMFSRREVVQPTVFDLGDLVRGLETLLARSLGELVRLDLEIAADLPHVLADHARIEQVLVNLAVNARDAMPQGGVLRVDVRGAGDGVAVTVRDEGTGMTPDVAARAFEPFFTTKERDHGTGLGLATAHGIVTDSGGEITIDSEPGRGTAVRFTLPAAAAPATSPRPPAVPEPQPAATGARVLVVEDQDPVRRQVVRILEAQGYDVHDAPSGDEALASWEPCDLLLTDVVMPGMSGHELAERASALDPSLRVVFMSGHTEDVVVLDGARDGEIAFVQKPFTRASLLRTVADALGEPAGGSAAA